MSAAELKVPPVETPHQDVLDGLVSKVCRLVFNTDVQRRLTGTLKGNRLVAVLSFWGDTCKGLVGLTLSDELARATHPVADFLENASPADLQSWVGEQANRLAAQLKAELYARGIDVWMSSPTLLRGVDVTFEPLDDHDPRAYCLGADGWLWLDLMLDGGTEALESKSPDAAGLRRPGDVVLF